MPANSRGAQFVDPGFYDAAAVTPSDTLNIAHRLRGVRGIWADVAGTVSVITEGAAYQAEANGSPDPVTSAQAVSFTLPAGQVLPLQIAYVLATGTAATGIKVLR